MKKRKRRINKKKIFVFLLSLIVMVFLGLILFNVRTQNIIVHNNKYYNDEDIISTSKLDSYPKFLSLNTSKIISRLKKLELISDVKVKKKYPFIIDITITEKKILFLNRSSGQYMLSDNEYHDLENIVGIPTLINYVPEDILKKFISSFSKLDTNVIKLISEIEYSSTSYDKERFLFYMSDDYDVYINNEKMNLMNKYTDIVKSFNGKKGVLYLDSGNYLEVKKK